MENQATKTLTAGRVCDKCGATILPAGNGFCAACLLETGLGSLSDDGEEAASSTPLLMDFGDYELLEELGRGGQGVVYRARQKSLNRIVALKVIGLGQWAAAAHIRRFRLEAEAAARLEHPGIVPIYEVGERDGSCYFSMKFVDGGQLDSVVQREPIGIRRAVEMVAKLARTVHYAHEHGILHRDIKPGNVLLDTKGEPHLTDFGLAKLVETESAVTNTFDVLGTPSYMAPEQAAGKTKELTAAADVYGLGAVFYQLLTGQPPFAGGTTFETIRMVMENEPRRPSLWNRKVDRDLETVALKCLEKDAQKRYSSALALAEDLERWLGHEPIIARRTGILARTRKWVYRNPARAILMPALAALVATLGALILHRSPAPPPSSGIAVLPFENLSPEKESAFFVDGIQDDILIKLAKVADLKVISRTSVLQYRGPRNTRQIGQALRVSHLLEGTVRKEDGRIRLSAQLIDARSDTHVWAEQYEGPASEVFAMQNKIVQGVVLQLSSKVSAAERVAIDNRPTQDLEAYDLYLRGKELIYDSLIDPRDFERPGRAISFFEQAIARDPNFALAYSSLAEAHLYLYRAVPGKGSDAKAKAEAALQSALRLAPQAGETHLAQALFFYWGEGDFQRALDRLDMAARFLPNSADVFRLRASIERRLGRWSETLQHAARAVELDPRNPLHREQLIQSNMFVRRYAEATKGADEAMAACPERTDVFLLMKGRAALQQGDLQTARASLQAVSPRRPMSVQSFILWFTLALYERNFAEADRVVLRRPQIPNHGMMVPDVYFAAVVARASGDHEKATAQFREARARIEEQLRGIGEAGMWIATQALADAALGDRDAALREMARAIEVTTDPLERPTILVDEANVSCWLGDREAALSQLEKLVTLANALSPGDLQFNPAWDALRNDARFRQLATDAAKPVRIE